MRSVPLLARRGPPRGLARVVRSLSPAALAILAVAALALAAVPAGTVSVEQPDARAIVEAYNAGLQRARDAVDSLRVLQEIEEPREHGPALREVAVLFHTRSGGMARRTVSSTLTYPSGEYTLASLTGPTLEPREYSIRLAGEETMDGVACFRLAVEAVVRDRDHIDGDVWVSRGDCSLVRIRALVSDPPFPLAEIRLDKRFSPGPLGFPLLRSHAGEVRAGLVLGRKTGVRHISYRDYVVNGIPEPPDHL
jgi:hypothetical protein